MRRRLAVTVFAATAMVVIAFVVPLGYLVQRIAEDREVTAATAQARAVGALLAGEGGRATETVISSSRRTEGRPVSVVFPGGSVVGGGLHLDRAAVRLGMRGRAFARSVGDGIDIYQPVVGLAAGTAVVVVHASESRVRSGVVGAWVVLGLLGSVLCASALLVADRIARSATRPLGDLASVARRLAAGEEDARAVSAGPPEVQSVAHALNLLANRVDALRAYERESLADLSHDLRTPVTALRLDAELLDPGEERDRILADVNRLELAVSTLITSARTGGTNVDRESRADVAEVVRRRLAFWSVAAREQARDFSSTIGAGSMWVGASARAVEALIDALIANALQHTPRDAAIAVAVMTDHGRVEMTVDDAGPEFPSGAVVERGARGDASEGTGLGLDIVRRTALAAGGSLSIARSPLGGARVLVRFPLVASPDGVASASRREGG